MPDTDGLHPKSAAMGMMAIEMFTFKKLEDITC